MGVLKTVASRGGGEVGVPENKQNPRRDRILEILLQRGWAADESLPWLRFRLGNGWELSASCGGSDCSWSFGTYEEGGKKWWNLTWRISILEGKTEISEIDGICGDINEFDELVERLKNQCVIDGDVLHRAGMAIAISYR